VEISSGLSLPVTGIPKNHKAENQAGTAAMESLLEDDGGVYNCKKEESG
jgi:hypothetical protein